jgi:hypothetical protein
VEVRLNFRHPSLSLIEQVREALRRAVPGHAPDGAGTLWEDLHAQVPEFAGARPLPLLASPPNCEQFCCGQETVAFVVPGWHRRGGLRLAVITDPALVQMPDS